MSITLPAALQVPDVTAEYTTAKFINAADSAPTVHAVQRMFTALDSGTAPAGIEWHSVSNPFTVTFFRPAQFASVGVVNPITGALRTINRNHYRVLLRKGVIPLAGQASSPMWIDTKISIPAGAESADSDNVEAAVAAAVGVLYDIAGAGEFVQMVKTGSI